MEALWWFYGGFVVEFWGGLWWGFMMEFCDEVLWWFL